jgi:hypothetical protein
MTMAEYSDQKACSESSGLGPQGQAINCHLSHLARHHISVSQPHVVRDSSFGTCPPFLRTKNSARIG